MPKELLPLYNVKIGDRARSFDFEDNRECYVEGVVLAFREWDGCERYMLRVDREVWNGEVTERTVGHQPIVYPPVNGTDKIGGGFCRGVEKICK